MVGTYSFDVHVLSLNLRHVPKDIFAEDWYPLYCAGASYMMSRGAVAAVLNGTHISKGFHVEDALYTGIIAEKMGILKSSQWDVFHAATDVS